MPLSLVTAPDSEPISLEQAKSQCELQGTTDHDSYLSDILIPAARQRCEGATRRQLLTATWDWWLDGFPGCVMIEIPKPPLLAVTYIKSYDAAGVLQTVTATDYVAQAFSGPKSRRGRIGLKDAVSWPSDVANQIGAVVIRFTSGYGDPDDVPPLLLQAMLMDISTMFEQRENIVTGVSVAELPQGSKDIYRSFKSWGTQWIEE